MVSEASLARYNMHLKSLLLHFHISQQIMYIIMFLSLIIRKKGRLYPMHYNGYAK